MYLFSFFFFLAMLATSSVNAEREHGPRAPSIRHCGMRSIRHLIRALFLTVTTMQISNYTAGCLPKTLGAGTVCCGPRKWRITVDHESWGKRRSFISNENRERGPDRLPFPLSLAASLRFLVFFRFILTISHTSRFAFAFFLLSFY